MNCVQPNPRTKELIRWMELASQNNHNFIVKPDQTNNLWLEDFWSEVQSSLAGL